MLALDSMLNPILTSYLEHPTLLPFIWALYYPQVDPLISNSFENLHYSLLKRFISWVWPCRTLSTLASSFHINNLHGFAIDLFFLFEMVQCSPSLVVNRGTKGYRYYVPTWRYIPKLSTIRASWWNHAVFVMW